MNKIYKLKLFTVLFILFNNNIVTSCQTLKNTNKIKSIEFIPKEYGEIKLGFRESEDNMFTPPNADFLWNEIVINAPQKIICNPAAPTGASLQLVPKTTEVYNFENVENK